MVLMSESRAKAEGREVLARIVGMSSAGVPPEIMGIGPVPATRKVMEHDRPVARRHRLIEVNEAFAAQVIACERELKFDRDRLNPKGGGISVGHPIGLSGTRITLTLAYEMREMGYAARSRDAVRLGRTGHRGRPRARLAGGRRRRWCTRSSSSSARST